MHVLTNFAPESTARWQASIFSSREQCGFENDFDKAFVCRFHDIAQFAQHKILIAILEPPNIEDYIDFRRAIVDGRFCFEALRVRVHRTQRKTDDGTNLQLCVLQKGISLRYMGPVDTNTVEVVLSGFSAEFLNVLCRRPRPEQRVINKASEFSRRERNLHPSEIKTTNGCLQRGFFSAGPWIFRIG